MTVLIVAGFACVLYCGSIITDKKLRYTSAYQILVPIAALIFVIVMFISELNNTVPNGEYIVSTEISNRDNGQSYYYNIGIIVERNDGLSYCVARIVKPDGKIENIRTCDFAKVGDPVSFIMSGDEDKSLPDYYEVRVKQEDIPVSVVTKLKSFSFIEAVLMLACAIVSIAAEVKVLRAKSIQEYSSEGTITS